MHATFNMVDETTKSEVCQLLRKLLPHDKFTEVESYLKEDHLEQVLDKKYKGWLNSQNHFKPCDDDNEDTESHNKENVAAMFETLVHCTEPVDISDGKGWDEQEMITYRKQAFAVMRICQILLSTSFVEGNHIQTNKILLASHRRFVMKKAACCLVSLCAANTEEQPWTSPASRITAQELLSLICLHCQCSSVSELLCGCVELNSSPITTEATSDDREGFNTLFPMGLFRHVLDYLRPRLLKDTWKKSPLACHVLVWCTMQVKHPYLGDHFPKLMSPLLVLIDDYEVDNKVLGLKCLKHVVDNMNSAELQWYGRADVLFEATQRHLYTSEACLVHSLHPCLLSILKVLEPSSAKPKFGRKTSKCDTVFQIILTSMEFESRIAMRRACASHLKDFIQHMGITILRHFKRLSRVIVSYLEVSDYPEEEARLAILDALNTTMLYSWPRIPHYSSTILKSLLKLLVDATDSAPHLTTQAYQQLKLKISECLLLLLRCCGKQIKEQLSELTKGIGHREVEDCATNVLKEFEGKKNESTVLQGDVT